MASIHPSTSELFPPPYRLSIRILPLLFRDNFTVEQMSAMGTTFNFQLEELANALKVRENVACASPVIWSSRCVVGWGIRTWMPVSPYRFSSTHAYLLHISLAVLSRQSPLRVLCPYFSGLSPPTGLSSCFHITEHQPGVTDNSSHAFPLFSLHRRT